VRRQSTQSRGWPYLKLTVRVSHDGYGTRGSARRATFRLRLYAVRHMRDATRHINRISPGLLNEIRARALEEIARGLVCGAELTDLRPMAEIVMKCERRLLEIVEQGPAPCLERRQQLAATATHAAK
jgi:hypothetical protein